LKCIKTFKNGKAEGLDDIPTTIPYYSEYDHTQPILRMNQNGFRPKRSTLAKILALRRLIEGIKSEEFAGYSDIRRLSKVFDSIHRG